MTDNEIMYALCQCSQGEDAECSKCAYADYDYCHHRLFKDALELIQRQQAEIERLEEKLSVEIADGGVSCHLCIKKHRAEAIKEFALRLREKMWPFPKPVTENIKDTVAVLRIINDTEKEMVGDNNES